MTRNKKFSNIIKYIKAENSGKGQIQVHYNCDEDTEENWFNRYVSDMSLGELADENNHINLRVVPFNENIPDLTESEWALVSDALRWVKAHNLEATVSSRTPRSLDNIIDKISKRHLSHKGQSTELLEILEGMKNGVKYGHLGWNNTWQTISDDGYNLYHMANDARNGKIKPLEEDKNGESNS